MKNKFQFLKALNRIRLNVLLLTVCVAISLLAAILVSNANADSDGSVELIANISMVAPGGNGSNFTGVSEPVIENGQIYFFGSDSNSNGFFKCQDGVITRIVDSNMMVPGSNNLFGSFLGTNRVSVSNGQVVFAGGTSSSRGVFVANNGQINPLVQVQDSVPAQNNQTFAGFINHHIENGSVIFGGAFAPIGTGIYLHNGNDVTKVIDSTDGINIPGINQNFHSFFPNANEGSNVLFTGGGFNSTTGIYLSTFSGSITTVADINTPIPEGKGNFTTLDNRFPNIDNGQIVFVGSGPNFQSGIYLADGNGLTKIVDRNTLQPGSNNPFTDLREPIIDNGRVFFQGIGSEGQAIYKFENGEITRLIGAGDMVSGQLLAGIGQNMLDVDGNTLTFVGIIGFNTAIFSANLVNPGDVNCDGTVNLLDVEPFIDRLSTGTFQVEADTNQDGVVNLLDVDPFIAILAGG